MSTNPRTSVVTSLLDDANSGRDAIQEALTDLEKLGDLMIRAGHRVILNCSQARSGVSETTIAINEIRRLRPSVQGRRSDIEVVA